MQVVFDWHPLQKGSTFWNAMAVLYLGIFGAYWLYNLVHLLLDLRAASAIRSFTTDKLGLSERQLRTVTWPDVARRIVEVRACVRGCMLERMVLAESGRLQELAGRHGMAAGLLDWLL